MGAVNSRAFGLPGVRKSAMGHGTPKPIGVGDGSTGKTGGIRNPRRVELQPGLTIVRFGQKRLAIDPGTADARPGGDGMRPVATLHGAFGLGSVIGGQWWLEKAQFQRVADYAKAGRITVGEAVSALCVVPPEWSDLDVVIVATLTAPLLAYSGLPNPADVKGVNGRMRAVPVVRDADGREIRQLYIPGLGNADTVRQALMWGPPTFLHPVGAA